VWYCGRVIMMVMLYWARARRVASRYPLLIMLGAPPPLPTLLPFFLACISFSCDYGLMSVHNKARFRIGIRSPHASDTGYSYVMVS
jgi:hypothetical protein